MAQLDLSACSPSSPVKAKRAKRAPAKTASKRPPSKRAQAQSLRAEARLLTTAGLMLLVIGFPVTLYLVALALTGGAPAVLPLAVGAPPIVLGYLACHFASQRMIKAKALERRQPRAAAASKKPILTR